METARSTKRVDMSPEAVAARLRDLAALYALGRSLLQARIVGRVDEDRPTAEGVVRPESAGGD